MQVDDSHVSKELWVGCFLLFCTTTWSSGKGGGGNRVLILGILEGITHNWNQYWEMLFWSIWETVGLVEDLSGGIPSILGQQSSTFPSMGPTFNLDLSYLFMFVCLDHGITVLKDGCAHMCVKANIIFQLQWNKCTAVHLKLALIRIYVVCRTAVRVTYKSGQFRSSDQVPITIHSCVHLCTSMPIQKSKCTCEKVRMSRCTV